MLGHLILCFCLAVCSAEASSMKARSSQPIGDGLTVLIHVIYDSTLRNGTGKKGEPFLQGFKNLFKQVQQDFYNEEVIISTAVTNAENDDNFNVAFNDSKKSLDGPKTLKKLQEKVQEQTAPNNTIFYLFTKKPLLRKNSDADTDTELHNFETRDSFCSTNTSAAVVTFDPQGNSHHFARNAMSLIFGSIRQWGFDRSDKKYMKQTFARCHGN